MKKKRSGSTRPRKGARLGQHFLSGTWAAEKLARSVAVREGERILEIGPGKGALTRELLKTGASVIAIEKDEALAAQLREIFSMEIASGQLEIRTGDIRDFEPSSSKLEARSYCIAANIPYYITGEIIRQFLETQEQPRAMALLIQKEVADRILGSRRLSAGRQGKESILSISVKAYGTPSIVAKVSRGNFSPPPSVDSAILLVEDISKAFFADVSEKDFFSVVRAGFAAKRKFLANNLAVAFGREPSATALAACGIPEKARAEDLTTAQWRSLAKKLSQT